MTRLTVDLLTLVPSPKKWSLIFRHYMPLWLRVKTAAQTSNLIGECIFWNKKKRLIFAFYAHHAFQSLYWDRFETPAAHVGRWQAHHFNSKRSLSVQVTIHCVANLTKLFILSLDSFFDMYRPLDSIPSFLVANYVFKFVPSTMYQTDLFLLGNTKDCKARDQMTALAHILIPTPYIPSRGKQRFRASYPSKPSEALSRTRPRAVERGPDAFKT